MLGIAVNRIAILWAVMALAACTPRGENTEFRRLSGNDCVPYTQSKAKPVLGTDWQPYLSATRICPLVRNPGDAAVVMLVSVFITDYYRGKPDTAKWENFPKPVLVHKGGRTLGALRELFPEESPGEMVLTYGKWQGGIPGEIRMHIINPAVGGNYDLPPLFWTQGQGRYIESTETPSKDG